MTNSTSQAVTEVVGKIAGTHGDIRVTQPDGTIAVARSGAELLLGTTIETFGSSIVVVKINGFKPVSLGHDTKITIDQALLDSMKDELEGSLDEQINFDALAQAIEGGENLEELLPATAAGGESGSSAGGSSNGSARFELTNDSVSPESGFETSATQNSETDSYIEDRDYFNNPPVAIAMPDVAVNQDADFVFDVGLAFFEGDEGQTLSFDVGELPDGLSFDSETNLITGAATNGAVFSQDGTYNITITARDDSGAPNNSATNEFVLQVNNVNDAPVAGLPFDLGQINEDGSITFDADLLLDGASDIDLDDVLGVSNLRTENGEGTLTDNGDGTYTFTPNANWHGDVDFSYDVSDGEGGAAANTGALSVASVNDLPVVNPDFPLNIAPETTLNVDVLANDHDVDGDQLSVIDVSAESGSVTVESDGSITYTPFDDFVGNDTIEYTVSDGNGGDVAASIDVAVVYNPGVVTIDPLSEQETSLPTISGSSANLVGEIVLTIDGNDYTVLPIKGGSWSLTLPEGSELADGTYEIVATGWDALGNPAMASETVVVDVEMPSISINEQDLISESTPTFTGSSEHTDGDFTVELNGNTYSVTPSEDGSWSFTSPVELEDGEYTLTVSGGDAQGNSTSISSEGLIDAQLPQIIINDQDEASSTPTFSGSAEHIDGDLTLSVNDEEYSVEVGDNGEWSITLPEDVGLDDGDYTVVVSGTDPQGNSTSVEDTFTVDEQIPSIVIDPIDTVENDQPVISGSSENIDGDITVVIGDDEYTVTPNEDGSWSVEIPEDGSLPDGDYTVVVEGDDGQGNEVSEEEDFVVDAINDVPTISGDVSASVAEDSAEILTVSGDLDATGGDPGEDLFVAGQSAGVFGTFSVNENGTWEYQADNNQNDIQSLSVGDSLQESFVVTNVDGVTSETVVVTITGTNDLPSVDATISSSAMENDSAYVINLLEGASDIDANDVLSVSDFLVTDGGEIGLFLDGNDLNVDPNAFDSLAVGENATINFEYFVEDNQGGRIAQSGSITITGQNDTPVVSQGIDLGSLLEDGSLEITEAQLLNGVTDIDGDTLTIENLELSEGQGSLADNGNGTWTYTPASDWNGSVSFDFEVSDGSVNIANTASLAVVAQNDAPEISAAISATATEDDVAFALDLLDGASDIDGDALAVANLSLVSGDAAGVSVSGNSLTVDPNAYNAMASGDADTVIVYNYDIIDSQGGSVSQTATITITAENDAPEISAAISATATEDDVAFALDLLDGASDIDGDALAVANLSLVSGDAAGVSVSGNSLTVDPNAYNAMASGDADTVIVYNYDIIDGQGGSVSQTATITITAENDAPEISAAISATATEDDVAFALDLLDGASDIDGDALAVANLSLVSGDAAGVSVSGNSLTVDPNAYNAMASGDADTVIVYNYDIIDSQGGSVSQTATITITAENDAPEISAAISATATEDDAPFVVDLLQGAVDPDVNDALSVSELEISGDDAGAVVLNGNALEIDPTVYNALRESDAPINVSITYNIVDGNGGVVEQSVSLTITGENDVPTISGEVSGEVVEDSSEILSVQGGLSANGGDAGEELFIAETLSGVYGSLVIDEFGAWVYSADNNQAAIQALTGGNDTLEESFVVTNADGATTQNIAITIRGSESSAPEIIVQDGEINPGMGSIDKDFVGDDYDFSSQSEAEDATGLSVENMLVEFASDITVTFLSEAAGFNNTLGWYSVGADGSINDVSLIWANGNDLTPGESVTLENVSEGEIGFFIIQDGYSSDINRDAIDAMLAGDGVMRFETRSGELAEVTDSGVTLHYYSEGDADNPSGDTVYFEYALHSTHGNLNLEFLTHSHSGLLDGDENTLVVGFEDLYDWPDFPGLSDWDLQDMVFSVSMRSAENYISDIAPSLQIVDDGATLTSATVNLELARDGDFLILSDETEVLAESYGINASYDSATRTMSFDGDASITQYEDILSSVQLMNDEEFGTEPRQINFSVIDSEGLESDIATVNLNSDDSYANSENDFIAGDYADNELSGLLGDDIIFGAQGDDSLSGGEGSDTFIWAEGDEANNAQDSVTDFEVGLGGDVLNFSDLLEGEDSDALTLDAYFDIESDGTNTTVNIDVNGDASGADMSVVLEGIDLTILGGDQAILQNLLDNGNLVTD